MPQQNNDTELAQHPSNNIEAENELDDLFDDIRGTCQDCEHPRCIARIKSAKRYFSQATVQARETFIPIRGYEGLYEVSNLGNVRSIKGGRRKGAVLRVAKRFRDYRAVSLCKDGKSQSHFVHRLVADNFISNPKEKRTVNHIDSNPANNTLENLEWATHSENEQHAIRNGKLTWNNPKRLATLQSQSKGGEKE